MTKEEEQAEIRILKSKRVNMFEQLQCLEKKDKIIDEMAKQLYIEGFCKELKCKKCTAKDFIICIKQYFERKINNENI